MLNIIELTTGRGLYIFTSSTWSRLFNDQVTQPFWYYEFMSKAKSNIFSVALPYILLGGGGLGLLSSLMLALSKIQTLENPSVNLLCDLNPVVSCGTILETGQINLFGIPDPFFGIAGFSALITIGVALLAGAHFKRWFWLGLQTGATFGVLFVHWLIYQSLYEIGSLCPYCMVVWVVTIPLFWYTTLYNFSQDHIPFKGNRLKATSNFLRKHHGDVLVLWYLIIVILITQRFWYYWSTLV